MASGTRSGIFGMERGSNLGPRALEEDALSTPSVPQVIHINFCPPYFTLFHLTSRAGIDGNALYQEFPG